MPRNQRVLILDDEVLSAMGLKAKLLDAGWDAVFIAGSFQRAMELLDREAPNVAVVDINLQSELSGLDFVREASGLERVVILSGYGAESYAAELGKLDYHAFLEKPVSFEAIIEALS